MLNKHFVELLIGGNIGIRPLQESEGGLTASMDVCVHKCARVIRPKALFHLLGKHFLVTSVSTRAVDVLSPL